MVFLPINTLLLALAAPIANQGVATNHFNLAARTSQSLGNAVPLRIMPLGASITFGWGSSDGNGYRQDVRAALVGGNPINMVGSRQHGSMPDNDVEGWPGYRIEQVQAKALAPGSVPHYKPNVVLLNAGTNDALQGWNVSTAGQRTEQLIRALFVASPRAVVVLSTLIVNKKADANVQVINRQFVDVAKRLIGEGKKVVLVDMHSDAGPTMDDLADATHPNDVGYKKMANIWLGGLLAASDAGWLQAPEAVAGVPDNGA